MENKSIDPWRPPDANPLNKIKNFISKSSNTNLKLEFEFNPICNGSAFIFKAINDYRCYGLANKNKEEILPRIYESIEPIEIEKSTTKKNLLILHKPYPYSLNLELYDIDEEKFLFEDFYSDWLWRKFFYDRLVVAKKNKYGFINTEGKVCIPLIYEDASAFRYYDLAKVKLDGKYGLIDVNGKPKIPNIYDNIIEESCYNGFAVEINSKWKFIDKNGNDNSQLEYDEIENLGNTACWIKTGDKWGILTQNGHEYLEPKYKSSRYGAPQFNWKESTIIVGIENYWGIINWQLKIVLPIEYEEVKDLHDGIFAFKKGNKWSIVSSKGLIINSDIDEIDKYKHGRCLARRNNLYGYIDNNGLEIIPFVYQFALPFSYGKAVVKLNDKFGFIDTNGKVVISLVYYDAKSFEGERTKVKKKMFFPKWKWVEIDGNGNEL